MTQQRQTSRRTFLKATSGALAAGYFSSVSAAPRQDSPNEKLNIAAVGTQNRAGANISGVASQNIVCLADIDSDFLAKAGDKYKSARRYTDYRVMLEKEAEKIDAVVVGTPDHSHAPAAAMAMKLGKHCYCEKPLTHTVFEARTLANLAKKNNLVTQLGTQIHSLDNYRRVVELVQANAIGPIKEVHVWAGAKYTGGKFVTAEQPKNVNWDLFLGPAPKRPYCLNIHPFHWRNFWDYGTGALGDFGCHYMDLVHWALKLRNPIKIKAHGEPFNPVTPPPSLVVEYHYPSRGALPAVDLTWYDSGKRPALLSKLKDRTGKPYNWGGGQLFVGSEGMILSDYSRHVLLPQEKYADFKRPPQSIPKSIGHHNEWIEAIKNKGTTTCNFEYSGALTESVLLGTVAYRAGEAIEWDPEKARVINSEKAQQFVHKEYRKGWAL